MATKKPVDSFAALEALIHDEAATYLKDARTHIRKNIEQATLSLLGLEKRGWDAMEIDHCNGRNSVLIDAFRNVAIEEATKIATNYRPDPAEIVGYANTFRQEMRRHLTEQLRAAAIAQAKKEAEAIVAGIKVSVDDIFNATAG